jgi:hypothetical protein
MLIVRVSMRECVALCATCNPERLYLWQKLYSVPGCYPPMTRVCVGVQTVNSAVAKVVGPKAAGTTVTVAFILMWYVSFPSLDLLHTPI